MDGHPPKAPAVFIGEPMVQAHVRVPDSVNRSEWLKKKSGGRRRRSVHGSRHAIDGRGNPPTERDFSPPPRDRDVSVDSRASSMASSTSTTISRVSMVSAPPRTTQPPRQDNNSYKPGAARRYGAVGDRGRRRVSFDAGPPRATATSAAAAAASAETTLSSSSPTSASARCAVCRADFTRYRRPHRCRACGKAVCATCSPARMPKRTCKRCAGGSAAPRVVASVSPPRQAVAAPYAPPTGVARAARRSVGSSARVMVAGPPSKPVAVVARATYSARASVDRPKEEGTGELGVPNRRGSANASREGAKASGSVGGVGDGGRVGGSDLLGGVGRRELEESTSPAAGDSNEEVAGLGRPDGDRVETAVGALGNASQIEDALEPFPNGVLINNSPNRMGRKSTTAVAEPDDSVPVVSVGSGRGRVPPLSCGASGNAEGQVVCGPEASAATADVDGVVSSEGFGGGGGRELEESAGSCLPADASVELAASPVVDGDSSHEDGVLKLSVSEQSAPEVVPAVIDGESTRKDEILKPPVSDHIALEDVAESEAAAAASCATATPPSSSPDPPERAEQQLATTNPEELALEPCPMESTEQPETAPSSGTARQLERADSQPDEERVGVALPQQVLLQPVRQLLPLEEDGRVEEEGQERGEQEAGLSAKSTRERSADEEATEIETTSSLAALREHHKEKEEQEQEVGEEHEDGVAQETEVTCVEGRVNNEEEGTEGVLAATAEFCAESSVDKGPLGAGRKATDMTVADVPQDTPEKEGQWDNESKDAGVEEDGGCQRKEQGVTRAPVAGLCLENGGDEEFVATKRGDAGSTAAQQQGSEEERGKDEGAEAAATPGEEHGEADLDFSTTDGVSNGESRVIENTAEPEEDSGLPVTSPTDEEAERGASSQDDEAGSKEKEAGVAAAAATEVVVPTLAGPGDEASGLLVHSEPEGRGPSYVPLSLDEEERVRGQEKDPTEKAVGGKGFRGQEGGVTDMSIVAPALPRDEEVGGGGPPRAVEPPTGPFSAVPEGAGDDVDVGLNATAAVGGDRGGDTTTRAVARPQGSPFNPPGANIEPRQGAVRGVASPGGVVLAEAGEGAGGFLAALKELIQKGGSCCH